jgi:hypothetical protein
MGDSKVGDETDVGGRLDWILPFQVMDDMEGGRRSVQRNNIARVPLRTRCGIGEANRWRFFFCFFERGNSFWHPIAAMS